MQRAEVIRVRPHYYMHVKDTNTGIVRMIPGAAKFTCLDHQEVVLAPTKMILVPKMHYVIIDNPVSRKEQKNEEGKIVEVVETTPDGQVINRHGQQEIRWSQPQPFPLYDGEICGKVLPMQIVAENTALLLSATRTVQDLAGVTRNPGDSWYFKGPGIYEPQVGVQVSKTVAAYILEPDQALVVTSNYDCKDYQDNPRRGGEEWLVIGVGAYLPGLTETVVRVQKAHIIPPSKALRLRAKTTFQDPQGTVRRAASEWLVEREHSHVYIPNVNETIVGEQSQIVLQPDEYCILKDPLNHDTGANLLGQQKLIRGPKEFFLQPGETSSVQKSILLSPEQGLWVRAKEEVKDEKGVLRKPGENWLVHGPRVYWPLLEAPVEQHVSAFIAYEPLDLYYFQPQRFWATFTIVIFTLFIISKALGV